MPASTTYRLFVESLLKTRNDTVYIEAIWMPDKAEKTARIINHTMMCSHLINKNSTLWETDAMNEVDRRITIFKLIKTEKAWYFSTVELSKLISRKPRP